MNERLITCAQVDERLAEWMDDELDAQTRAGLEGHIAGCVRCAGLVKDLESIRRDAAALPVLVPSRDLWPEIEARIQAPVISLEPARASTPRRSRNTWWMGVAAAGLVAVTAGVTHMLTKAQSVSPAPMVATDDPAVVRTVDSMPADTQTEASEPTPPDMEPSNAQRAPSPAPESATLVGSATSEYDRDVARLRAILQDRRSELDSSTVTVLERNLELIDRAIAESRAALERDPGSEFLADQLARVMTKKVAILRTAALLPSRS
ncbi:MAG: zf-HC2 domain-containing protein [Gemmatimonadota bacterium]|nr:zf-HC2 domain-containing protein [Gemmatimonadota bacterium]